MKKYISYLFVILSVLFIGTYSVKAFAIDSIAGGNTSGKEFSVKISGAKDAVLTYTEKDTITCTKCSGTTGVSGKKKITSSNVTLTFKINTSDYKEIKFTLTDEDEEYKPVSKTYVLNPGKKTTTKATTTSTTSSSASKNSNIKTLEITDEEGTILEYTPKFDPNVYEYDVEVESKVKKINVAATLEDSSSSMVISDNYNEELKAGETNKIVITVTAADGSKKQYTLNVKRAALGSDATLKSLVIKEVKKFSLKKDVLKYSINIKDSVKKLNISYELNDENATVEIEGNKNLKDGSVVKILVTSQDGSSKRLYELTISKTAEKKIEPKKYNIEKNPFIITGLSIIAFGLIGAIIYVIKK